MSTRDELHQLAAAYALDALDPDERAEFEAHLEDCAECGQEVASLSEVAAELALLAEAPELPADLRASVLAGVADVAQLTPPAGRPRRALITPEEPDEDTGPLVSAGPTPTALPAPTSEPVADELALRRANRRTRILTALVAAVTVVAVALGISVAGLAGRDAAPPTAAPSVAQVDPALLSAPDAKIYPATLPNGAEVSFVVSKRRNEAAFVGANLPSPGAGNVYHLWTLKGSTVVRPDNTLTGGDQSVQSFSGPIDDSDRLAVNIEPAGTNPQTPTTTVLGAVEI